MRRADVVRVWGSILEDVDHFSRLRLPSSVHCGVLVVTRTSRAFGSRWFTCRSSKLNLRRIGGPYPQRMPPASDCSVVSNRDGLRSITRCNGIHPTVAVIRTWPASVRQLSARCTDDEDRRFEAGPEVGVVRSGVAQPAGPPASSSLGRCGFGRRGNR